MIGGSSLLRALLMGATALTLVGPAMAQSKVGVTSATDGDPLGKPPSENERVLRIGIDVQANEVVTTHGDDRAHLVFLDGSSLTVGPNARLTIDKFVYDPNTKTGELAVTASQGVLRFVGGRISKTSPVTINTPSGTIGIRGGIGIFGVGSGKTTAAFLFGNSMTVTGQGQTQTMTRANSFVIVNTGASPSLPSLLPPGGLNALIGALEGGNNNSGTSSAGGNADQKAQSSGFSNANSGNGPAGGPPGTGLPPNPNTGTQFVSQTNGSSNPTPNNATPDQPTTTTTYDYDTNNDTTTNAKDHADTDRLCRRLDRRKLRRGGPSLHHRRALGRAPWGPQDQDRRRQQHGDGQDHHPRPRRLDHLAQRNVASRHRPTRRELLPG